MVQQYPVLALKSTADINDEGYDLSKYAPPFLFQIEMGGTLVGVLQSRLDDTEWASLGALASGLNLISILHPLQFVRVLETGGAGTSMPRMIARPL